VPDEDPSQPDLSHVTTEWLIRELFNRHDAAFLARETRTTGDDRKTVFEYSGGLNAAIGLVTRAGRWLDDETEDLDD
jgi:hypothetical protein